MSTADIAKAIMQRVEPRVGQFVSLSIESEALLEGLVSLVEVSGAELAEPEQAHVNVIEISLADGPTVDATSRGVIQRIGAGRRLILLVDTQGLPIERTGLGRLWAERLKLTEAHAQTVRRFQLIDGIRRPTLSSQERKVLRRLGHNLEPTVLVGKGGIGPGLVDATLEALERHGIVKVKLTRVATVEKDDGLHELAWSCGAEVVQRVGKTAVLRRMDVPLAPPASRRG